MAHQSSRISLGKDAGFAPGRPGCPAEIGRNDHTASLVEVACSADDLTMENPAAEPGMVTVQRRWFVPSEKLEEFRRRWDDDIVPALMREKGFIRAELYESDVRGHWLTSISWQDQTSRNSAFEAMAEIYHTFSQFERFAPETLTLLSSCEANSSAT